MTKKDPSDPKDGPVEIPDLLPILPLRNSVLFPGSIIPIDVGRKKSVLLVEEADVETLRGSGAAAFAHRPLAAGGGGPRRGPKGTHTHTHNKVQCQ